MRIKKILSRLKPNTVVKKCAYGVCLATFLFLFAAGNLMSNCIYYFLKPELNKNLSVLASSVSTKLSYILHQNCQYLLKFDSNPEVLSYGADIVEKKEAGADFSETREKLMKLLKPERFGEYQPGAIVASRNALLVMDWDPDTSVCRDEVQPYAQRLLTSDWYAGLPEELEELSRNYPNDLARGYSPVFEQDARTGTEAFLAFVLAYPKSEHTYYLFLIEPFSDFMQMLSDFSEADIQDYCLIGLRCQKTHS